jgi:hypothetical protein
VRIVLDRDDRPVAKGNLCSQHAGFNLHGATRVAVPKGLRDGLPALPTPRASRSPVANDKKGRETLCKYILRPPLANERLKILNDGDVRLESIVMGTLEGFPPPPAMVRGEQSSPAPHACPPPKIQNVLMRSCAEVHKARRVMVRAGDLAKRK